MLVKKKSLIQIKGKSLHSTLGLFLERQETQHVQQKGCIYTVHYILCVCVYVYIYYIKGSAVSSRSDA